MSASNDSSGNVPAWSAWEACRGHWRLYLAVLAACLALAAGVTLSVPRTYGATLKVADEPDEMDVVVGLTSYSAWIKRGMHEFTGKTGLLSKDVYRMFLKSSTFLEELSTVRVEKYSMSYGDYLASHHRRPWWATAWLWATSPLVDRDEGEMVLDIIRESVWSNYSERYETISIRVNDGDPEVAAAMADSVRVRLQRSIARNRSEVARANYRDALLNRDRLADAYHEAQRAYAGFVDSHFDTYESVPSVKSMEEGLRKERDAAYEEYSDAYEQFVRAKILVNKDFSSFEVIRNATVPLDPVSPRFFAYALAFTFLGLVFTTWWILLRRMLAERGKGKQGKWR